PAGTFTRPMQDKIKESLFSMLLSLDVDADRVADIYAGTGSIGIEAISRGASWCDFVEQNAAASKVVLKNIERCHFEGRAQVHRTDASTFIARQREPYDLIFLDPPYADPEIPNVLRQLAASSLIQSGTIVAIGHSPRVELPDDIGRLGRLRLRCHGDSCFSIYEADLPAVETAEDGHEASNLPGEL
ncbi:MAG: RsmD family RNA methyltransferase, partial [Pseudomonadales bacterium]|nr:RsmD family RNA methyltransferase [Pseudomonadales bacterium]